MDKTNNFIFPAKQKSEVFQFEDNRGKEFIIDTIYIAYTSHDNYRQKQTLYEHEAFDAFLNFFRNITPATRFYMLNPYMEDGIHYATAFKYNLKERITVTATRSWICILIGDLPFEKLSKIRDYYNISKTDINYVFTYLDAIEGQWDELSNRHFSIIRKLYNGN